MKKNYRKIPSFIDSKINLISSNELIICDVLKIPLSEINSPKYQSLGLSFLDNEISFNDEFLPSPQAGPFSKKNSDGYVITHKDKPKVEKTFDMGMRPYFGDWSKGSFHLFITKRVFPKTEIPPRENTIKVELIDRSIISEEEFFTFKVYVFEVINKNQSDFSDRVFFNINLLQENIFTCNIYESDIDAQDLLNEQRVNWEIFPPGNRDTDIQRVISGRALSPTKIRVIEDRYDFLTSLDIQSLIYGNSGLRNYFGAKVTDELVVFENTEYGNAIYILFSNWEILSRLSRTEILDRPSEEYCRIKHRGNWKEKVKTIIDQKKSE